MYNSEPGEWKQNAGVDAEQDHRIFTQALREYAYVLWMNYEVLQRKFQYSLNETGVQNFARFKKTYADFVIPEKFLRTTANGYLEPDVMAMILETLGLQKHTDDFGRETITTINNVINNQYELLYAMWDDGGIRTIHRSDPTKDNGKENIVSRIMKDISTDKKLSIIVKLYVLRPVNHLYQMMIDS